MSDEKPQVDYGALADMARKSEVNYDDLAAKARNDRPGGSFVNFPAEMLSNIPSSAWRFFGALPKV